MPFPSEKFDNEKVFLSDTSNITQKTFPEKPLSLKNDSAQYIHSFILDLVCNSASFFALAASQSGHSRSSAHNFTPDF